jgi:hypothetical protein
MRIRIHLFVNADPDPSYLECRSRGKVTEIRAGVDPCGSGMIYCRFGSNWFFLTLYLNLVIVNLKIQIKKD